MGRKLLIGIALSAGALSCWKNSAEIWHYGGLKLRRKVA